MRFINLIISLFFMGSLFAQDAANEIADPGPLLEPDPVSFSFETSGWYFLAGILFILLLVLFIKWLKKYLSNAYRRDALKKLAAIEENQTNSTKQKYLPELMALLKIVAINAYGRTEVATLWGKDWLGFLETKGKDTPFSKFENTIADSVYQDKEIDTIKLKEISILTKKWIKTHA